MWYCMSLNLRGTHFLDGGHPRRRFGTQRSFNAQRRGGNCTQLLGASFALMAVRSRATLSDSRTPYGDPDDDVVGEERRPGFAMTQDLSEDRGP